ncbi:MAG TPA: hypothetical protein VI121_10525, partial [Agromyces sp.]
MTPDVSRTIPEASSATQPLDATRNTRVKPGMPRLHATMARSERPRPAAARSCSSVLTVRGMRPTTVRCRPAEITAVRKARDTTRWVDRGRTVTTTTPYVASRKPAMIAVELKTWAEKSSNVPSCEKCSCHHSGSRVVSTATSTPATSAVIAPRLKWCALCGGCSRAESTPVVGMALERSGGARRVNVLTFSMCADTPNTPTPQAVRLGDRRANADLIPRS